MIDLLATLKGMDILVIGDIMVDRYIWGKVRRISPEAPVPVVQLQRTTETLGGAGNVVNNLAALGCTPTVVGLCGADPTAETLRRLLSEKGVRDRLIADPSRATITKTRIMADKQQMLRLDVEDIHPATHSLSQQIKKSAQQAMARCKAVVISDYGKGLFADTSLTQELIQIARQNGLPILVDPKGVQWERYQKATGITPNTSEFEAVVGHTIVDDTSALIAAGRQIKLRFGLEWLLITRGAKGMTLITNDDQPVMIPAQAREVFDVSGAGDTVIATLAAALGAGVEVSEGARIANLAAGIVVGKLGTQPILASELEMAIVSAEQRTFPYSANKMMSLDNALDKIKEWKVSGSKIVFTNGCFDLLHPGHLSLLYQAKSFGDRLVVGLNTDDSIKRLKGVHRPILSEKERGSILSALECVDLVVCFSEDTPLRLIETIRPDVLVKGSDYTLDQVVGRDVVESYGGGVKLVDLIKGYSTTQITQKVISGNQN
jgi:D-beta-D-heptose 7-phosphate kinase/D-beta-D-heptose 1-phosphate adenosyltransferase